MERILFCTKRAHVSYTAHANRHLRRWHLTAARMDLFVVHRRALLQGGVVHQSELRARIGVSRATMSVMLRRMEKRGFIERRRSANDRRKVVVSVTAAGYAAFEKARHLVDRGVYREMVDANLLLLDFREPLAEKRARFLRYIDGVRSQFGDLTDPPYPVGNPEPVKTSPMQTRADELLRRYGLQ